MLNVHLITAKTIANYKIAKTNDYVRSCAVSCGIWTLNILIQTHSLHNTCVIVSEAEYKVIQATNYIWRCPSCYDTNLSTSFVSVAWNIGTRTQYNVLFDNYNLLSQEQSITFMYHLKLELQGHLSVEDINIVVIWEIRIDSSIKLKKSLKHRSESTWSKITINRNLTHVMYRPPDEPTDYIHLLKDQSGQIKEQVTQSFCQ